MDKTVYDTIKALADEYARKLKKKVDLRVEEMKEDDNSHYLIYQIFGVTVEEGKTIDLYQNKGRFLYQYAGSFLEEAAAICIKHKYPYSRKEIITYTHGNRPKKFEIDCLVDNLAHEIKWRDATTDGDHISKEYNRVQAIYEKGYIPVRIMFYYPQREQAIRIQQQLEIYYINIGGKYYYGDRAWQYIREYTGIDLLEILEKIAKSRE